MIRENVITKIENDSLGEKWSVKEHCNSVGYETLGVNSDGTLVEREEPSSNSFHTGTYILTHTFGVPCNCDWCAEWKNNDNNVQKEFECKRDFIEACVYNNGDSILEQIVDRVKAIPYGFFNDEKEDEENDRNKNL